MNRYEPRRFHPFVGIAAAAMTALTFALSVGVPSSLAPTGRDVALAANAKARARGAIEVAIILPRIDVVGLRDTTVAERQQKPRV
jgi:hypothetical protein